MKKFTKKYQLWTYADYGYNFTEYDTLEEALTAERYTSDFYITRAVEVDITEK